MTVLKPYQVEGVEWLLGRETTLPHLGGFLCDDMGLGKTVQMIEVMLRHRKKHTLVVVPKSIVQQWRSELEKFGPSLKVCTYDGPRRVYDPEADVCVCPYSVLIDLVEAGYTWDRVILDEAHEIRNPKSLAFKTCMRIKAPIRWVLTGTPVFNRIRDFFSLCDFVGVPRNATAFDSDTRSKYILRRVKSTSVPIEFVNIELEMYEEERELYDQVYDEMSKLDNLLEGFLRCRQILSWPKSYVKDWNGPSAKLDALLAYIRKHPDEKSLVFTQFKAEAEEIRRRLESKLGRTVFVLDGTTRDREGVINGFKTCPDQGAVFVIQIKAGGVGLNLQEATRVYITQPSWNPGTELQAICRSHRSGQTKKVYVKKLVYAESYAIDNEITNLQRKKSKLCARVLDEESLAEQIPGIRLTESNFVIPLGRNLDAKFNADQEDGSS